MWLWPSCFHCKWWNLTRSCSLHASVSLNTSYMGAGSAGSLVCEPGIRPLRSGIPGATGQSLDLQPDLLPRSHHDQLQPDTWTIRNNLLQSTQTNLHMGYPGSFGQKHSKAGGFSFEQPRSSFRHGAPSHDLRISMCSDLVANKLKLTKLH